MVPNAHSGYKYINQSVKIKLKNKVSSMVSRFSGKFLIVPCLASRVSEQDSPTSAVIFYRPRDPYRYRLPTHLQKKGREMVGRCSNISFRLPRALPTQ